jgi:hypothetical protein
LVKFFERPRYGTFLALLMAALLCAAAIAMPQMDAQARVFWFSEAGIFENATLLFYFIAAAMFLFGPYYLPRYKWLLAVICMLFFARETDILPRLSDDGFLFIPAKFEANYPVLHTSMRVMLISLAVSILLFTLWTYRNVVRENLARRDPHQTMILSGWACVAASIILDGIDSKIRGLTGYQIPFWLSNALEGIEETVEMMIPICFIFGLLHYYSERRQAKKSVGSPDKISSR